ncbi:MAG: DNA polymerase III subunit gamma/tau [Pseudomonadota bacterium]|nr:DNA polymerase III subunit gamma/tau [Pseudomonadota bacterium]QKK04394.1 MAG: DNA polymerase III subunit gamma/tau [Pseudomonadota bacterium]
MSQPEKTESKQESAANTDGKPDTPYLVLARKYRPRNFSELIGQDALVRTLQNAIAMNRIAHAFILTGVRGVGKTTTARIIALALNCIGKDEKSGITAEPCGECTHCKAIMEGRHVDVLEMDAASRTGVDDVRDIIDSVQYAPASARFKIFIIDEIHMLSKSAFNALLKTLEEPPPHVKFIFATTEINKVPVTILSRCQRFDLPRIDSNLLNDYFTELLGREKIEAEDEAVHMIARAADGSARDGLSLLDRAIALSDGKITAALVRDMLGLSDRNMIFDLLTALSEGNAENSFAIAEKLFTSGADPDQILKDLLDAVHLVSKGKLVPESLKTGFLPETEKTRGLALADTLSVPALSRLWQILSKGREELKTAATPAQALDMVLIRTIYAAQMPLPSEIITALENSGSDDAATQKKSLKQA